MSTKNEHWIFYWLSFLLLIFAVASPLAYLSGGFVFYAHMIQHVLLLMVVPALLWMSRADSFNVKKHPFNRPYWAWAVFIAFMWVLHYPLLTSWLVTEPSSGVCPPFAASAGGTHSELSHILHALSLFLALLVGLWFYYPVLGNRSLQRLHPLRSVAYLVTACIGCSLLGIAITFSPHLLYPDFYPKLSHPVGQLVWQHWHITPRADQQIAGLIMWVPGCLIYLTLSMRIFLKWINQYDGTV
ncbi:MAG: cytochrome c oxidase assembly protein [Cytophagales bacterium]|nr:cytochrome c oxidase assembly protein [Cytophagales bacterium]